MPCRANQDDFLPTASWQNLRLRAGLLRRLREFFHDRGFLEVETPILSADTVVDRHLDPFSLHVGPTGGKPQTFWLQTSPEFAMKRLLAAGGRGHLPGQPRLPPGRTRFAAQPGVHARRVVSHGR